MTVRKSMRNMTFKLTMLSEKGIKYVKENGNAVAAANAIRLDFDLWKGKPQTNQTESERTTTTSAGYDIEIRIWTKGHQQHRGPLHHFPSQGR